MITEINAKPLGTLGFGGGPLGVHGFGQVDLDACRAAVGYAVERGITLFDTSDAYGKGTSEEQLARALGPHRDRAIVATKCGIRFGADNAVLYDSSPAWITKALDQSLQRLKTDHIDLYQLHYWDQTTPLEAVFETFQRLQEAGKIAAFGISNLVVDPQTCPAAEGLASYSFDYSMVARKTAPQIDTMHSHFPAARCIATGVLAQGLLSGKYDTSSVFDANDRRANPKYVNFLPEAFDRLGPFLNSLRDQRASASVLAIAWAMQALPTSLPLVGVKTRAHVDDMLAAIALHKETQTDWSWVDTHIPASQRG